MGVPKKVKKDIWEEIFVYPSFNIRFKFAIFSGVLVFILITFLIFKLAIVTEVGHQIAILNLIIQIATLFLGVFAAFYALRQLVETRFASLDQNGLNLLRDKRYARAYGKWKEAFYIRPEAGIFLNMCEALLLYGDYETFDLHIKKFERKSIFKKEIFTEESDNIILLYLRTIRYLFIKNQGKAEEHIKGLLNLVGEKDFSVGQWDFIDSQTSSTYQDLTGECKDIVDNLISFLRKDMTSDQLSNFKKGNFAYKSIEN